MDEPALAPEDPRFRPDLSNREAILCIADEVVDVLQGLVPAAGCEPQQPVPFDRIHAVTDILFCRSVEDFADLAITKPRDRDVRDHFLIVARKPF
jgi:hypothetical protein